MYYLLIVSMNVLPLLFAGSSDESTNINAQLYVYKDISAVVNGDIDFGAMSYSRAQTHPQASTTVDIIYDNANGASITVTYDNSAIIVVPPSSPRGSSLTVGEMGVSSSVSYDGTNPDDASGTTNKQTRIVTMTINNIDTNSIGKHCVSSIGLAINYN